MRAQHWSAVGPSPTLKATSLPPFLPLPQPTKSTGDTFSHLMCQFLQCHFRWPASKHVQHWCLLQAARERELSRLPQPQLKISDLKGRRRETGFFNRSGQEVFHSPSLTSTDPPVWRPRCTSGTTSSPSAEAVPVDQVQAGTPTLMAPTTL